MRDKKAFTLIELLVVISVIVLLMALLFPVLRNARNQASAVVCQSNLRQWGIVFSMYLNEYNEELDWHTWKAIRWWRWSRWYHGESDDLLLCPMARRHDVNKDDPQQPLGSTKGYGRGSKFTAWKVSDIAGEMFLGSYELNIMAPITNAVGMPPNLLNTGRPGTVLLLDGANWLSVGATSQSAPPAYDGDLTHPRDMKEYCIDRHSGGVNALFLAGSVRKVGLKELWTLDWYRDYDTAGPWTKAGGVQPEDWPQWMRKFKDY